MKKLLFQLDTDTPANTFDTVVAYDGGADHVTPVAGVTPDNVSTLVEGAIFTRSPKNKKFTALFVTGSSMKAGEALFAAVQKQFFSNFRVSVMLDSNGANTTAAAAVAMLTKHVNVTGKQAVILAGTGPVGQRTAVMLAQEGAQVLLTSRKLERAQTACAAMRAGFGVDLHAGAASDPVSIDAALAGAQIVITTGPPGIQLLSQQQWVDHPNLEVVVDANSTPPLGIAGTDMMDKGESRNGKISFGAIGFGALKLELHRACIARLFESNDQALDAEEIYALAKTMV